MAGNIVRILAVLDDKVSPGLAKMRDGFDRIGQTKGFKQFTQGVGMGAGISAWNMLGSAISGVTDFAQESIEKASHLNETMSKNTVVFGESAKGVASWGTTLAKSFGISKQAGVEAAASFGNVFTNIGFAKDEAAKMSKNLVELAGDLASFNDLKTDEALEKLRAGLAGEAEPLRSVGVFLTEAKVKAKAMEMGLAGAHGELTEGAKIAARYQLILEQTTTAQGDFARTADDLANSQRSVNAELENAQALYGQGLLPIQLMVTKAQLSLIGQLTLSTDAFALMEGKLSLTEVGMERYRAATEEAASGIVELDAESQGYVDTAKAIVTSFDTTADSSKEYGDELIGVRLGVSKLKATQRDLIIANQTVAESFGDVTTAAGKWADWIYDNTQGVDDLKHELDLANDELREEHKRLRELEAIKNPTKDQRRDIKETRVKVDELERRTFNLNGQLAALGDKPARDALRPYLNSLRDKLRAGLMTALEYKEAVEALGGTFTFRGGVTSRNRRRSGDGNAYGGQLHSGQTYLVGEKGPELFTPRGSGGLTPNHQLSSSGGGSTNIYVNVSASGVMTPATAKSLAEELGPSIYNYLYRRGALTRAG